MRFAPGTPPEVIAAAEKKWLDSTRNPQPKGNQGPMPQGPMPRVEVNPNVRPMPSPTPRPMPPGVSLGAARPGQPQQPLSQEALLMLQGIRPAGQPQTRGPMQQPAPRPIGGGRTPNPFTVDARPIGPSGQPQTRGLGSAPNTQGLPPRPTGGLGQGLLRPENTTPNLAQRPAGNSGGFANAMSSLFGNTSPVASPGKPGSATGATPNIGGMPGAIMKKGGKVMAKAPVKKAAGGKVAAKPVAKKAGGKVAAKPMGKPIMKKAGGRVAAKPLVKGRKK